jgi:multidrug efflux pump subunit AcrA (membrane-fusion protein)
MADPVTIAAPNAAPTEAPSAASPAAAPKGDAKAVETKPEPRKFKVALPDLGEVDLPENDVIELVQRFASGKYEDFKAKKQLAELEPAFDDEAKLEELLRKRGKDPAKLAEAWLAKEVKAKVEEATLTPEQRRIKELEAKLAAEESAKKADLERKQAEEREAQVEAQFKQLYTTAVEALKQTSLPAELHEHPDVLRRLGAIMRRNEQLGTEVSSFVLAKQLEAALVKEHDYVFSKFSNETLFKKIGPKRMRELVKMFAADLKPPAPAPEAPKKRAAPEKLDDPAELRRRAHQAQYERAREEQRLLSSASIRPSRYYGK